MSTYTKEKNIVIITLDGSNGSYRFDINSGILYGIKGAPIKTCPRRSDMARVMRQYNDMYNLADCLRYLFNNYGTTDSYRNYVEVLQTADKLDALGIPSLDIQIRYYEGIAKYFKMVKPYLDTLDTGRFVYQDFIAYCEYEEAKKQYGSLMEACTPQMWHSIKIHNFTEEEIPVAIYYLGRGKMWEYHHGSINHLVNYFEYCKAMNKKPEKVNNFMREFCETKQLYELKKTEFDNIRMSNNYAKHSKAWEFTHGDYVVMIPKTAQDIVREGELMHHCVGGYVNRVITNDCYICFIRHKDKPNIPYITCQVYINGEIGQYFLAYDQYIRSQEDREFYEAFQNYLREIWNK